MPFTIKTASFEGPLDLLLDLVEQRKMLINDVSLSKVTDDFIDHVKNFGNMPMGESAHFILVASTLLLIKSKSLLPQLNLTEEEQGDIKDLETRLKIFRRIREASKAIQGLWDGDTIFAQSQARAVDPVFAPDPTFTLEKALASLQDLIKRLPKKETLSKVIVKKVISLEDMIGNLTARIGSQLKMSFKQFTAENKHERVNIIVSFLAMLELVKQGVLQVSQADAFADIEMETNQVGLPKY